MANYDAIAHGYRPKGNFSLTEIYAKTRSEDCNKVFRSRILAGCDNEQKCVKCNPKLFLHGISVAIKDNFCAKDTLTTCASLKVANFVPNYNATVYQELKDARTILIGKTNLNQFAMASGTVDSYFGASKNLWGSKLMDYYDFEDTKVYKNIFNGDSDWFIAGGSSGGSALSISSGVCFAALGLHIGVSPRNLKVPGILTPRICVPKKYCCQDVSKEVDDCWVEISDILEEEGARIIPLCLPYIKYCFSCYSN